jgi:hypothetical protein
VGAEQLAKSSPIAIAESLAAGRIAGHLLPERCIGGLQVADFLLKRPKTLAHLALEALAAEDAVDQAVDDVGHGDVPSHERVLEIIQVRASAPSIADPGEPPTQIPKGRPLASPARHKEPGNAEQAVAPRQHHRDAQNAVNAVGQRPVAPIFSDDEVADVVSAGAMSVR